jgi:hypothetical protein
MPSMQDDSSAADEQAGSVTSEAEKHRDNDVQTLARAVLNEADDFAKKIVSSTRTMRATRCEEWDRAISRPMLRLKRGKPLSARKPTSTSEE